MKIAVVALGKIGLPLAVQFASKGHDVVGVDVNQAVVDLVNAGTEPFPGEAELGDRLATLVARGTAAGHHGLLRRDSRGGCGGRSSSPCSSTTRAGSRTSAGWTRPPGHCAEHLTPGTLVSYETTLPVGTTRTRWKPMIEEVSGLTEGVDFHLVFSPERVLTGRVFADLRKYPKLVGALERGGREDRQGVLRGGARLRRAPGPRPRPTACGTSASPEASELAKLAETTYRDVNIGLANQFARFAEQNGIDVHAVIEASNSQPYSHIHRPGIAVGGHCIPVYPRLYLFNDPDATVVRAAREANAGMPDHAITLLEGAYGDLTGARVAVLGAAYRGGVKETAFSGVFPLVAGLRERGADRPRARPDVLGRGACGVRLRALPRGGAGRRRAACRPITPRTASWTRPVSRA